MGDHQNKNDATWQGLGRVVDSKPTFMGRFSRPAQPAAMPEIEPGSYEIMNVQHFDWPV